jgi:hypothetical protein
MYMKNKFLYFIALFLISMLELNAQCPMCVKSAERSEYAATLNTGILYLLLFPFLVIIGGAIFWHKNKKSFIK